MAVPSPMNNLYKALTILIVLVQVLAHFCHVDCILQLLQQQHLASVRALSSHGVLSSSHKSRIFGSSALSADDIIAQNLRLLACIMTVSHLNASARSLFCRKDFIFSV